MSLAPGALGDLSDQLPPAAAKAQHETLIRAIEAHGLLVFTSPDEERELLLAARGMGTAPPGVRNRWLTVLEELKKRKRLTYFAPPVAERLGAVTGMDELRQVWGRRAQVAVLPDGQAAALGVDGSGLYRDAQSNLEVAAAHSAAYCNTLDALRELADRGVLEHGASRDDFFKQVLLPVALLSRRVVVVDQYLFGNVCWHHDNRPRSARWDSEAVVWLLRWLDRVLQPGAEVVLMGASGGQRNPRDAADAAAMITDLWQPAANGQIARVDVVTGPWRQGDVRMPHDRHIRFSAGAAVKSLPGFDRLGRSTVQDEDGMGWQYHWKPSSLKEMREAEKRIEDGRQSTTASVLSRGTLRAAA
ncbi:hypothetical protein [Patulibacter sp. SYSU D01012]|uniref:hypothetical protein n=1 Tax=Patulibacter sp. SYSU D01012 TaxID=2817381 RepID=UPI001B31505A|nr:hypothetical protein [Patulibacter sp. SYSU D01012]